ncbi:MAG: DUF6134 family protein [Pseudomonadota bacterium]
MQKNLRKARLAGLLTKTAASLCLVCAAPLASASIALNFHVWLDDREVGTHQVRIDQQGSTLKVQTDVKMRIRALFIDLFNYQHTAYEEWSGDCLQRLTSETRSNSKRFSVDKRPNTQGACAATFAYWDLNKMRAQTELLNSQTGEAVAVDLVPLGPRALPSIGSQTEADDRADAYLLKNELGDITLWYSQDQRWLALETETRGRTLTYLSDAVLNKVATSTQPFAKELSLAQK